MTDYSEFLKSCFLKTTTQHHPCEARLQLPSSVSAAASSNHDQVSIDSPIDGQKMPKLTPARTVTCSQ